MAPGTAANGGNKAPPPITGSLLKGLKKGGGSGSTTSGGQAGPGNGAATTGLVPKQFEVRLGGGLIDRLGFWDSRPNAG